MLSSSRMAPQCASRVRLSLTVPHQRDQLGQELLFLQLVLDHAVYQVPTTRTAHQMDAWSGKVDPITMAMLTDLVFHAQRQKAAIAAAAPIRAVLELDLDQRSLLQSL